MSDFKSEYAKRSKNPKYWIHSLEDKTNGILQQMKQNLPADDPSLALCQEMSDKISDHIHWMGEQQ